VVPIDLGIVSAYVLQGDRSVLVDTGYPGSHVRILKKLSNENIHPGSISLILITHGHVDHFGSALEVKGQTEAPIAIHRLDTDPLRKGLNPLLRPTGMAGQIVLPFVARGSTREFRPFEPDILIGGEMSLEPFGVKARVISTPGHTPGSVSIILSGGETVIGDLMMGGIIRKRRPNYPLFADDIDQVRRSIQLIMEFSQGRIFSSHGGPFEPETIFHRFPWIHRR